TLILPFSPLRSRGEGACVTCSQPHRRLRRHLPYAPLRSRGEGPNRHQPNRRAKRVCGGPGTLSCSQRVYRLPACARRANFLLRSCRRRDRCNPDKESELTRTLRILFAGEFTDLNPGLEDHLHLPDLAIVSHYASAPALIE